MGLEKDYINYGKMYIPGTKIQGFTVLHSYQMAPVINQRKNLYILLVSWHCQY
jgi:hypothetical protein